MSEPGVSAFSFPTDIRFGAGARHLLADELGAAGRADRWWSPTRASAALPFFVDLVANLAAGGLDARSSSTACGATR